MTLELVDKQKAEAFGERLLGMLNQAGLSLMISIGHRTGLFDAMSEMEPATPAEIAEQSGLQERYVREWLGAMALGGIVQHEPATGHYYLPPEHAACLTRAFPADNVGVFAQYIAVLGSVEDQVVECFKKGGGVPYSEYKRFHEVMAEESGQSVVSSLLEDILPLVPGIQEKLTEGIQVLDLGCGRGHALLLLAETYPNSRFTGFDLSEEAVAHARAVVAARGLTNVSFEARDLRDYHEWADEERYDFVTTFDAVHDQPRPDNLLAGIHKTLHRDGTYLMVDIAGSCHVHNNREHPIGPLVYTISCMHCMTVSLAQDGMGLGAMWGEETALEMLREAGFRNVVTKRLPHDFQNNYYVARKS